MVVVGWWLVLWLVVGGWWLNVLYLLDVQGHELLWHRLGNVAAEELVRDHGLAAPQLRSHVSPPVHLEDSVLLQPHLSRAGAGVVQLHVVQRLLGGKPVDLHHLVHLLDVVGQGLLVVRVGGLVVLTDAQGALHVTQETRCRDKCRMRKQAKTNGGTSDVARVSMLF